MATLGRKVSFLLFAGDLCVFTISLYLTLLVRHGAVPDGVALEPYILPFALLFALWTLVFYSSGLYSKRIILFPSRLPNALFRTQTANILFAALLFFLVPAFGIAPKTILALYLGVSLSFISLWRLVIFPRITARRTREKAILLAQGEEADELCAEVQGNARYGIEFVPQGYGEKAISFIVDSGKKEPLVTFVYAGKPIIPFEDIYEEIFDRVPLSYVWHGWFHDNVSSEDSFWYVASKRLIDIVGAIGMGVIVMILIPFVWIANYMEGTKPLFIKQERFGYRGARIFVYKFRTMTKNLTASDTWMHEEQNRVTKVGAFLRNTSLDEFPQCMNILKGEMSLIGPRNDILGLGKRLAEALPYYEMRYRIKPGITGWAQIYQQYEPGNASPQSIKETKVRLAYDFYYLKHRSFMLDVIIALKTIKRMFFRVSRSFV